MRKEARVEAATQRRRRLKIDPNMLEYLRERHWKSTRAEIGKEIEVLMPTVLIPPEHLREPNHETGTMHDVNRTIRVVNR